MGYVEGQNREQVMLLSIDDLVAPESMVRVIDLFIDACDLKEMGFTHTTPAQSGRPPYDPRLMAKLYLYGYKSGIRSSRRLEVETHRNVEAMWLMMGLRPDHKTIAEFRRQNIRPIQKLFHKFNALCKGWDLIGGALFVVDGTKIKASNNKKMNFSRKKLDARMKKLDEQIKEYLDAMEAADQAVEQDAAAPDKLKQLLERRDLYAEYIKSLDATGENELSVVDPDARLMGNNRGGVEMAYNVQSAVDAQNDLIAEFDASMNPSDHYQLGGMVKKVKRRFKIRRFTVLADKGYYNGEDLLRVKRYKVKAIVSRQKPSDPKDQPEAFHTDKFVYAPEKDAFTCPMGKILTAHNKKVAKRRNFFSKEACADCPHRKECARGPYRTVTRSQYSEIYEETDQRFRENKDLYKRRQMIVEHPFGTIKHALSGGYFLLRTRRKVRCEVALLFLSYNLKRVLNVLGFGELMARLKAEVLLFFVFDGWKRGFLFVNGVGASAMPRFAVLEKAF